MSSVGWAQTATVTISMADQGWTARTSFDAPFVVTSGDVTLTFTEGTAKPYFDGTNLRIYKSGGSMTVEASGNTITRIEITGAALQNMSAANGTYVGDSNSRNWTPTVSVTSEMFTVSGTTSIGTVSVTYTTNGTPAVTAPVFSIDGSTVTGTQAVDNGTVVNITAASGNYLRYTTDGTNPASSTTATTTSGNTAQVTVTQDCTIRAIALDDDDNESDESTLTLTVNAPITPNIYTKVTSGTQLVAGKQYIIVNEANGVGMGPIGMIGTTSVGTVIDGLTFNNSEVNIGGKNVVELTLAGDSVDGWTFVYDGNYLSWSSGNSLTSATSVNNNSRWTVASKTQTGGVTGYALTNKGDNTRTLLYNSTNPRFACYASNQSLACLYVKVSEDPTLTVTPPSQTLEDIAYNADAAASTSGTIHVAGAHLTGNVRRAGREQWRWGYIATATE